MSDDRLRRAEQAALEAGPLSIERWRLRVDLVRAGRTDDAGLEPGDRAELLVDLTGMMGSKGIPKGSMVTIDRAGCRDGEGKPLFKITDGREDFWVNAPTIRLVAVAPYKVVPPCNYSVKIEPATVNTWVCYHANKRVHILHEAMNDNPQPEIKARS